METEIIIAVIGAFTTLVAPVVAWVLAKRKYHTEADQGVIENMEKSLEFYEKLSNDNKARLDDVIKRNQALELEIQELRKQILELTLNICLDLTCAHRMREPKKRRIVTKKEGSKLDETVKIEKSVDTSVEKINK